MTRSEPNNIGWLLLLIVGLVALVGLLMFVASDHPIDALPDISLFWAVAVLGWLALAGLGAWVAAQKRRSAWEGFALGLIFGPLGVLVEALLPVA